MTGFVLFVEIFNVVIRQPKHYSFSTETVTLKEDTGTVTGFVLVIDSLDIQNDTHINSRTESVLVIDMGCLRLVGSLKVKVFFAKEPYKTDDILPKETYNFKEPTNHSHPWVLTFCP